MNFDRIHSRSIDNFINVTNLTLEGYYETSKNICKNIAFILMLHLNNNIFNSFSEETKEKVKELYNNLIIS